MEKIKEFIKNKRMLLVLIISGVSLILSFFNILDTKVDIAIIAVVLCGIPIVKDAILGLVTRFDIKAGVLVSLAFIASLIIGAVFVAGEVVFIMMLGEYLENTTIKKTKEGVRNLLKLVPNTARRIVKGSEEIIDSNKVEVNDIIRILPGETIPVDGIIIKGETSVNQSIMTGESMPSDKAIDDEVYSGTLNQFGTIDIKTTKTNKESSLQKLIDLISATDPNKAKIVRQADKLATALVIIVLSLAIGTWLFTGSIIRAIALLVVFCPCALVLATPTAIIAGIGNATKHGILVKRGNALENLAKVNIFAFDKTGTLTYGEPVVSKVHVFEESVSEKELLLMARNVEKYSEHAIGKTIVKYVDNMFDIENIGINSFQMFVGKGVVANVNDSIILAGNKKLLKDNNISLKEEQEKIALEYMNNGASIVYIAKTDKVQGFIVIEDKIRDFIENTISEIEKLNVKSILITGDNNKTAQKVANIAKIDEFYSECGPEEKLLIIENLQKQNNLVGMIGDGINDAPSLKKAYAGIAMGTIGSDIAIDVADIVLVSDDINKIPYLLKLSKKVMRTIRINLILSLIINLVFIVLSIKGLLTPTQGAIAHNIGSFAVVLNSALILRWNKGKLQIGG